MRFLPFINIHSTSGKKEFLEEFNNFTGTYNLPENMKKLAAEISGDFYGFMFGFLREKINIENYKYLAQNVVRTLFIRVYGLLESDQTYLTKKDVYAKLYIATIAYINKNLYQKLQTQTIEEFCDDVCDFIGKSYFELIAKIKDYEEPYNYKDNNAFVYSRYYYLGKSSAENLMNKALDFLKKYTNYWKIFSTRIIPCLAAIVIIFGIQNYHLGNIILLSLFTILLVANLWYIFKKTNKVANTIFYPSEELLNRLGADLIEIHLSENLIPYADPMQKHEMIPDVATVRLNLTDDFGYIIPNVKLLDSSKLKENTLAIYIRAKEVLQIKFYPEKILVAEPLLKLNGIDVQKLEKANNIFSNANLYWAEPNCIENLAEDDFLTHRAYFQKTLYELSLQYVDTIYSIANAAMYYQLGEYQLSEYQVHLNQYYNYENLRDILVALLSKRISVKDVVFITEKIHFYCKNGFYIEEIIAKLEEDLNFHKK